jgi:photosynthetic reaction center H subunit
MPRGFLTENLDVAQVVLYAFWVFFAGLIFYIRREDRREGYPLENDKTGELGWVGFPFIPDPKTFILPHGLGTVSVPSDRRDTRPVRAERIAPFAGAPLEPTGNPLLDSVGPGSYAERADRPDLDHKGGPRLVPMRLTPNYHVHENDPDPRGWAVVGCDGHVGGTVADIWIDSMEQTIRYLEVDTGAEGARTVLLPINFVQIESKVGEIYVHAIRAGQFVDVPATKNPDQVTLLEEEKVMAYYGGGTLYALPQRAEPIL